jgi:hypothetical protein
LPKPLKRELEVWAELWASPQAVVWEEQGAVAAVARYARLVVRSEARDAQVTTLEDRLGLTPKAMRLLLWTVADSEDADVVPLQAVRPTGRPRPSTAPKTVPAPGELAAAPAALTFASVPIHASMPLC